MFFVLTFLYTQDIDNDVQTENRTQISIELMNSSLNENTNFDKDFVPDQVIYKYYFRDKFDLGLLFESPDYIENPYYPYSFNIDENYLNAYPNYYAVYYDLENKIVKEEYYENKELIYYTLYFYELSFNSRERIAYIKEGVEYIVFDYFHYKEESASVAIKYTATDIDYLNVKYKNLREITLISEAYNSDLIKHGIWYYYRNNGTLKRKEYWENGYLIKYITYDEDFNETYHDNEGNVISASEFYNI
jgi:hypothetical protein